FAYNSCDNHEMPRRPGDGTPITRVEDVEPPRAGAPLRLVVLGDGLVSSHALPTSGEVTIGRSSRCDVSIDHDSLSRTHVLLRIGARLEIEDCGSKNGTLLAGARLQPGRRVPIRVGEAVTAGAVTLLLQRGGPEPRMSSATRGPADAKGDIILIDPAMRALYELALRVAPVDINVLVLGETGVGKDLLAHAIHRASPRAEKPF